jgi:anti-sigma regulatory factor (Ser/Thr protein kinase)
MADDQLRHEIVLFGSPEEFAAVTAGFAREGLERGEDVVVAADPTREAVLRDLLGPDAAAVTFTDVTGQYRGLVVPIFDRPHGSPVWLAGEPPADRLAPDAAQEWLRCESAMNGILPRIRAHVLCAFDVASPNAGQLCAAHEAIRDGSASRPNPAYRPAPPEQPELPPPPEDAVEFHFGLGSYARGRRLAAEFAAGLGLTEEQEFDLGLAVTELTTNAVRHGGGSGTLRLWKSAGALFCEVSDNGPGLGDPLRGYLQPPAGTATSGWGLWLVRRVADLAQVRTGPGGTVVRMRMCPPASQRACGATRTAARRP